jgi:hypothetical protein
LPPGTHTLRLEADPANIIPESNEADNVYVKDIVVLARVPVGPPAFSQIEALPTGALRLTWSQAAKGMTLQRSASLVNPQWQDIPGSETVTQVALPLSGQSAFFRLAAKGASL